MKKIIILILVLLVLGLYFYTAETKLFLQKTGQLVRTQLAEGMEEGKKYTGSKANNNEKNNAPS